MEKSSYIEDLQKAAGDKEECEKVLGNIAGLQQYLIQIGVKPELTQKAGFIFLAQEEMKFFLSKDSVRITDKGIVLPNRSMFIAGKNGGIKVFHHDSYEDEVVRSAYVEESEHSADEITYIQDTQFIKTITNINSQGAMEKEIKYGKTPFANDYSERVRTVEDGIPIIIATFSDGASFNRTKKDIDLGNPFFISSTISEFYQNYETYIEEYPMLEGWYQDRFPGFKDDIKGYSENLRTEQLLLEIRSLEDKINLHEMSLNRRTADAEVLKRKLEQMIAFLKAKGDKNPLIRGTVNGIFKQLEALNNGKVIPEEKQPTIEVPEEKDKESLKEKKQRLASKLNNIQEREENANRHFSDLKISVDSIKIRVSAIPIIGTSLTKKINQEYVPKLPKKEKVVTNADEPSL